MVAKIQRLACIPNNYPWGPVGQDSLVVKLAPNACPKDVDIKNDEHYAELWMGTHPTQPSQLHSSGQPLSQFLAENRDFLGDANKFKAPFDGKVGQEGHVPFLFKILCANQALPLQVHPNKDLATKLHKENPEQFPDTNHKPEIAVCLSDRFLGFAGFRVEEEIRDFLTTIPEVQQLPSKVQQAIKAFVDDGSKDDKDRGSLRKAFEEFVAMKGKEVETAVKAFTARVQKEGVEVFKGLSKIGKEDKERLVEATGVLEEYNPGDGSILVALFFMNLVELKKGEGMYVGADGVHAWLKGNIVELMAISDNVLNVGFTEDKDSTRLVAKTMTAAPQPVPSIVLKHETFKKAKRGNTQVYSTPFEEFSILGIKGEEELEPLSGPGIAIVLEGEVTLGEAGGEDQPAGQAGSVYLIGAGAGLRVKGSGEVWMAFYDGDSTQVGAK